MHPLFLRLNMIIFLACLSLLQAQDRPNIILIYADDLDADELEYTAGSTDIWPTFTGIEKPEIAKLHTPHINSIAEDGIVFTRFYVNSSVCTPSRYNLMSGRLATRGPDMLKKFPAGTHAQLDWFPAMLRSESSIAKELQKLGYRTGIVGKWHNMPAEANMPKIERAHRKANPTMEEISEYEDIVKAYYQVGLDYFRVGFGWDVVDRMEWGNFIVNLDWMAEGALNFIDESKNEPFFLYLPLPVPHGQYKNNYNQLSKLDGRICASGILDKEPGVLPSDEDVYSRCHAMGVPDENAMATHMDDYIGAVLGKLDQYGFRDNTLVIFTSDHGSRGKNSCFEGAIRMPFFAAWPAGITPGTQCESLCGNIDVAATLIEVAGGVAPADMNLDGRSFLPLMLGDEEPSDWRTSLFIEAGNSRAVVTKKWKYIANRVTPEIEQRMKERPGEVYWTGVDHHNYNTENMYPGYWDADQLYDLDADLYEQNNIFRSSASCKVIPELKKEMDRYVAGLPHTFGEFGE